MRAKILNTLLLLTSLIGYLEWGGNNHLFIAEAEREIILKLYTETNSVIHPLILLPISGQLLLLFTLIQKKTNRMLSFIGITAMGCLLYFMLFVGIISLNYKIIISTLPFFLLSIYSVKFHQLFK